MYHTESYIDHESVDSNQHMISLAGSIEGRDVVVWAVWKERELLTQYRERLKEWFSGELGTATGKGEAEIRRELVRICSGMQCRMYLYYGRKLYRAGERVEEGESCLNSEIGASVHKEGGETALPLEAELEKMRSRLAQGNACVSENKTSELQALGNVWQQNIMDCIAQDSLSYAYFMLWETR